MKNKIIIQLYADKYGDNTLVPSILNKNFGFELIIENDTERSRRILSLEEVKKLKASIEDGLNSYEKALDSLG